MGNITSKKLPMSAENVENNSDYGNMEKNEMTIERTTITGTPFTKIWSKEHGWSGGIAEHRMTGWYKTEEELLEKLQGTSIGQIDWDLMVGFVSILIEKTNQLKELNEKINKKQEEI